MYTIEDLKAFILLLDNPFLKGLIETLIKAYERIESSADIHSREVVLATLSSPIAIIERNAAMTMRLACIVSPEFNPFTSEKEPIEEVIEISNAIHPIIPNRIIFSDSSAILTQETPRIISSTPAKRSNISKHENKTTLRIKARNSLR